ncbi:unnamed protein product [Moneuplotes crassus]|uniref:K Homology domain-containing protein n=1 Tax=Euplotes crassus TaxID=5936 RepID=A0AAD1X1Y4_EUPCR|nr:unnamed protein product [Moneuplotes crassus]
MKSEHREKEILGNNRNDSEESSSANIKPRDSKRDYYEKEQKERDSRSPSESLNDRPEFDVLLLISKAFHEFIDRDYLDDLKKKYHLDGIQIDKTLTLPDIQGDICRITSPSIEDKVEAADSIIRTIVKSNDKNKINPEKYRDIPGYNPRNTVMILIPEGMVAIVIGKNGKRIKSLSKNTNTKIVVSQPIVGFTQRSVTIKGYYKEISDSIFEIHRIMEDKAHLVSQYEFEPDIIDLNKIELEAKLVFHHKVTNFFKDKGIRNVCYKNKVDFTARAPVANDQVIVKNERVLIMTGLIRNVEKCIHWIMEKAHEYKYAKAKILVPGNLVSKLIGSKGCLIREISSKSGGAHVSVLSDKKMERISSEILVEVTGECNPMKNATLMVLEQIELFKRGGPVLQSGRVINKNMVAQFENSVSANTSRMKKIIEQNHQDYGSQNDNKRRRKTKESRNDHNRNNKRKNRGWGDDSQRSEKSDKNSQPSSTQNHSKFPRGVKRQKLHETPPPASPKPTHRLASPLPTSSPPKLSSNSPLNSQKVLSPTSKAASCKIEPETAPSSAQPSIQASLKLALLNPPGLDSLKEQLQFTEGKVATADSEVKTLEISGEPLQIKSTIDQVIDQINNEKTEGKGILIWIGRGEATSEHVVKQLNSKNY